MRGRRRSLSCETRSISLLRFGLRKSTILDLWRFWGLTRENQRSLMLCGEGDFFPLLAYPCLSLVARVWPAEINDLLPCLEKGFFRLLDLYSWLSCCCGFRLIYWLVLVLQDMWGMALDEVSPIRIIPRGGKGVSIEHYFVFRIFCVSYD